MNSCERFLATIERREVDRPACWLGIPTPPALDGLLKYFGVGKLVDLKRKISDDVFPVELPYHSPVSDAIYAAFDFSCKGSVSSTERTLTSRGFFAGRTDTDSVNDFDWPDPRLYINPKLCIARVTDVPEDYAALGVVWSAHFQDACAAFGMEDALIAMLEEPDIFRAVIDRIVEFYLTANRIFYESTIGKLHAVLIGNDFGSQNSLIVSPELLRKFVLPGTEKLVKQAKSYGLKVIHHSCGAIRDIIPDLVELGVDVIHPIQALAIGMDAAGLKEDFGNKISFCGGVDAQNLLVRGNPNDVEAKVGELKKLFPTGLVISPSHEAILADIPPANIEALFAAVKS